MGAYTDQAARYDDKAGTDLRIVAVCLLVAALYATLGSDGWDYLSAAVWAACAAMFVGSYRWHRRAARNYRDAAAAATELARLRGDT